MVLPVSLCPVGEAADHTLDGEDAPFELDEWECLIAVHAQCDGGTVPCAPCAAFVAGWSDLAERIGAA